MNFKLVLCVAWAVLAAVFIYMGIVDTIRWRSDPEFTRLGLDWTDSYLPHAAVAAIIASASLSRRRAALWTVIVATSVFGLYFSAYLVFGGEGAFHLRVILPVLLLGLTTVTIRFALRSLRSLNELAVKI